MEIQRNKTHVRVLQEFIETTRTNWRNSVYIECTCCKYGDCGAKDFLYAPGADGRPLFFPVSDAEIVYGRTLDKSECLLSMSNARFEELFSFYFKEFNEEGTQCPLLKVCAEQSKQEEF